MNECAKLGSAIGPLNDRLWVVLALRPQKALLFRVEASSSTPSLAEGSYQPVHCPGSARLRDSEEQLGLETEAAEVGLWNLDLQSYTLFWLPRVKAISGISADTSIPIADFYTGLHPDDVESTDGAFAVAVGPDQRALYDVEYRTIGNEERAMLPETAGIGFLPAEGGCSNT